MVIIMSDQTFHLDGIVCRGTLLGYAKVDDSYTDKQTKQRIQRDAHLVGVERISCGRFREIRKVTVQLRIPDELVKDGRFFNQVEDLMGQTVEIPLSGYSDFQNRLYISNDAQIYIAPTDLPEIQFRAKVIQRSANPMD